MSEWLKVHAWKACLDANPTGVRIPLAAPYVNLADTSNVLVPGFEPGSPGRKPEMMGHYTIRAADSATKDNGLNDAAGYASSLLSSGNVSALRSSF